MAEPTPPDDDDYEDCLSAIEDELPDLDDALARIERTGTAGSDRWGKPQ